MTFVARRRIPTRAIVLDRSLESLPIFRLSDSAEDTAISFSPESGGRWRVLPSPGDRLPGTFDRMCISSSCTATTKQEPLKMA